MSRINTLDLLHPAFRQRLELLISRLHAEGWMVEPFETIRSPARQNELYALGRDPNAIDFGRTRTHAKAYESAHQFGKGCDLVFHENGVWHWPAFDSPEWRPIREMAPDCGLETLAIERPHVQELGFDWRKLTPGPMDDAGWLAWLGAGVPSVPMPPTRS